MKMWEPITITLLKYFPYPLLIAVGVERNLDLLKLSGHNSLYDLTFLFMTSGTDRNNIVGMKNRLDNWPVPDDHPTNFLNHIEVRILI